MDLKIWGNEKVEKCADWEVIGPTDAGEGLRSFGGESLSISVGCLQRPALSQMVSGCTAGI